MECINDVLAKVRGEIESLSKDKSGHNNNYVSLPSILEMINPVLAANELSCLIHSPEFRVEDGVRVYRFEVILGHKSEVRTLSFWIPEAVVPSGKKKDNEEDDAVSLRSKAKAIQNFGATETYGQRYIYHVVFGIPLDDEDPDGNLGSSKKVSDDDIIWWMKTIPSHSKSADFTPEKLIKQFKLFSKGDVTKQSYIERGY